MRLLIRILAVMAGLVALLFIAVVVLLPGVLQSDAVRHQVEAAAESALGRQVSLGALDVGFLPPSLLVAETRVAGPSPDAPPSLEAREVALRLALMPLLGGAVVVNSLKIDGATLRVVRDADGLGVKGAGDDSVAGAAPDAGEDTGDETPMTIAVRKLEFSDATLVLDDRTVKPTTRTHIGANIVARGSALDAPVDLDAVFILGEAGDKGEIRVTGTATLGDTVVLDLELDLADLALAPFAPYVGERVSTLAGLLSGSIALSGPAGNPSAELELDLAQADIGAFNAVVRGPVTLRATLADVVEQLAGPFELEADEARVRYGELLDKAAGTPLVIRGKFTPGKGTQTVEDFALQLDDLKASGSLRLSPGFRANLRSNRVDLKGWEEILVPLANSPLKGGLEVESLAITTGPTALKGRVALRDVVTELPDKGPVTLSGALLFNGDVITTEEMVAIAADQTFKLDARVEDLFGTLRYEANVNAAGADVNALASTFAGQRDTLMGPLNLSGRFHGTVESGKSPLDTLKAELDFDITKGKLVGVTILEAVMGQLGRNALEAGAFFVGPEIQRFYGEEFDVMKGALRLDGGLGYSKPLSIQYRDYGVELVGDIDLAKFQINMEGRVVLSEAVDAVIAKKAGANNRYVPRRRDIPLAAVKGTLSQPKVSLAAGSAALFTTAYAKDIYGGKVRDKIDKEIDDKLGTGAAKAVEEGLGALEGLFGGRKRGSKQATEEAGKPPEEASKPSEQAGTPSAPAGKE